MPSNTSANTLKSTLRTLTNPLVTTQSGPSQRPQPAITSKALIPRAPSQLKAIRALVSKPQADKLDKQQIFNVPTVEVRRVQTYEDGHVSNRWPVESTDSPRRALAVLDDKSNLPRTSLGAPSSIQRTRGDAATLYQNNRTTVGARGSTSRLSRGGESATKKKPVGAGGLVVFHDPPESASLPRSMNPYTTNTNTRAHVNSSPAQIRRADFTLAPDTAIYPTASSSTRSRPLVVPLPVDGGEMIVPSGREMDSSFILESFDEGVGAEMAASPKGGEEDVIQLEDSTAQPVDEPSIAASDHGPITSPSRSPRARLDTPPIIPVTHIERKSTPESVAGDSSAAAESDDAGPPWVPRIPRDVSSPTGPTSSEDDLAYYIRTQFALADIGVGEWDSGRGRGQILAEALICASDESDDELML